MNDVFINYGCSCEPDWETFSDLGGGGGGGGAWLQMTSGLEPNKT